MRTRDIIKLCKNLPIKKLDYIRDELKHIRNNKFNSLYEVICIHPGERIEEVVKKETKFHCYHVPSENGNGRGTTKIVIPKEQYTEKLAQELITKYDDKW